MDNEAVASGGAGSGGGANEVGPVSGVLSPKSRMKFLCSYGGKILPISADGHLKYVGGETRFVAVPRDITFSGQAPSQFIIQNKLIQKKYWNFKFLTV